MAHRDHDRFSQIERITAELIGRSGYYATSLQSIADRVGITKAGLLHYVGTKDNLLNLVMHDYDNEGLAALGLDIDQCATASDTEIDKEIITTSDTESDAEFDTKNTADTDFQPNVNTNIKPETPQNNSSSPTQKCCSQPQAGTQSVPEYFRRLVHANAQRPEFVRLFTMLNTETLNPDHPGRAYFSEREQKLEQAAADPRWNIPDGIDGKAAIMAAFMAMDGIQIKWLREPDRDLEAMWQQIEPALFPPSIWGQPCDNNTTQPYDTTVSTNMEQA